MRRSTTTAALALATAGLLAVGSLPAAAGQIGPDHLGHHDVTRWLDFARSRGPASSAPRPTTPVTVAEHLAGPLTFGVDHRGSLYVGQAFAGAVTLIRPGQAPVDLVSAPGLDVAAVSTLAGSVTWAETTIGPAGPVEAVLKRRSPDGTVRALADLFAYERGANPDAVTAYGFRGLTPECVATLPPGFQSHTGHVDSHPYGSAALPGMTFVADAGANAILRVDHRGRVSTVAVLPGTPVRITAAMAATLGLDACVADHDYVLEPVPTDVEIGWDGNLYVSSLPGGPEDGSLGAHGSVFRVNPWTGATTLVATGFAGATNIAVSPNGTVYVAELFGGQVSSISRRGVVTPVVSLTQPAGLEWAGGRLYVSTNVFGDGSIVSLRVS